MRLNLQSRSCRASGSVDALLIVSEKFDQSFRGIRRLRGRYRYPFQEEFNPIFPCSILTYLLQKVVVAVAIGFEIEAEIQQRRLQCFFRTQ